MPSMTQAGACILSALGDERQLAAKDAEAVERENQVKLSLLSFDPPPPTSCRAIVHGRVRLGSEPREEHEAILEDAIEERSCLILVRAPRGLFVAKLPAHHIDTAGRSSSDTTLVESGQR